MKLDNILSAGISGVSIPLLGQCVTINGIVYDEPICIARLLTVKELERVNLFDLNEPVASIEIEQDIVNNTFESFIGITDAVDWDGMEAGIVSTLATAIVGKSMQYVENVLGYIEECKAQINVLHSMQAIVSRFMSTPFREVEQFPVNELFRLYTICLTTFQQEVNPIETTQNE